MNRRSLLTFASTLALPTLLPSGSFAQAAFPNRPIRVAFTYLGARLGPACSVG
jgi:hypothetical protein